MDYSPKIGSSLVDFAVSKLSDTTVKELALMLLSSDRVPQIMFEGPFFSLSGFFSEEVHNFRQIKPEYRDLVKQSIENRIRSVDTEQDAFRNAIRAQFQNNQNNISEIFVGLMTGVIRQKYVTDQLWPLFDTTDDNSFRAPKPEYKQLILSVVVELYDILFTKEGR